MTGPSENSVEEKVSKTFWKVPTALACLLTILLVSIILVVFQDNLSRFVMNPRTPFQTLAPPPAPDFTQEDAWLLNLSAENSEAVDVFVVHSTTSYSRSHWNAPFDDPVASETTMTVALPNEAGPFLNVANVHSPRYRQATLFAFFTHKYDGTAARKFAFDDVDRAFTQFLTRANNSERPIILAGFGQGGLHVLGLLQSRIDKNPELQKRLAVAYVVDHAVPPEFFSKYAPNLKVCDTPTDFRCVVSYVAMEASQTTEIDRLRRRAMIWNKEGILVASEGKDPICVNPLSWTTTTEYFDGSHHKGAASATGLKMGDTPAMVKSNLGAQCIDGILQFDTPKQEFLTRGKWFGAKWKAQPFNLFYHDMTEDVLRRSSLAQAKLTLEAETLAPISDAVDLTGSPINKVPG